MCNCIALVIVLLVREQVSKKERASSLDRRQGDIFNIAN